MLRTLLAVVSAWLIVGCSSDAPPAKPSDPIPTAPVLLADNTDIAASRTLGAGIFHATDSDADGNLRIVADGITLDLTGATLIGNPAGGDPDTFEGAAIRAEGRKNVTIKGGTIRGYRGAIYLKNCTDCTIELVDISDNRAQRLASTPSHCDDGADWLAPHFNDQNEWWTSYGAGITLDGCERVTVRACSGKRTQNGIVLRNSNHCTVIDNAMSCMSGWGLALWRSSDNEISCNNFDRCVRGYSHGVYDRGQDSAGILLFEQCNRNIIALNSATHGGDGIFIYAGHETTQRTGEGGCNDNLLWRNDFSHAVANAIECTFSRGNRFIGNKLDDSNYGIWAGYSYETKIVGNTCWDARIAGVAIEHGHDNLIEANRFVNCADGVQLWWDDDADLLKGPYGKKQNTDSAKNTVSLNRFARCRRGVWLKDARETTVDSNEFTGDGTGLAIEGACPALHFEFNAVDLDVANILKDDGTVKLALGPNLWKRGKPGNTDNATFAFGPSDLNLDLDTPTWKEPDPHLRGKRNARADEARFGMASIVIGLWGPLDPSEASLTPSDQTTWGTATLRLSTAKLDGREIVTDVSAPHLVAVAPDANGAKVAVGPPPTSPPGIYPWTLTLTVPGRPALSARGTVILAKWDTSLWNWEPEPTEHDGYEQALDAAHWEALLKTPPVFRGRRRTPDRPWEGINLAQGDNLATRATTTMKFPAGKWKFTTVSDDGVRLSVDGKVVIERWTWHGPETDTAAVEMTEGEHTLVLEYFQIDGHRELTLGISK